MSEAIDSLGELVKSRIVGEFDLIAVNAKYHSTCLTKFFKPVPSARGESSRKDNIAEAMEEIFFILKITMIHNLH